MEINPNYILEDCPICRGSGMVVHEGGWNVQVECTDCSAHTVYVEYANNDEKMKAEEQVVTLWNLGKVIKSEAGE
ncbi:MAG: Lar family restriction alleviation protein [Oscillospiraceae bacterium]|nr:Lar family restriction alleviation protein [Oscillospiraceae bacterium]